MNTNRREYLRQQTHQEILETARKQIAQTGAASLSLRGIARQMGVTAPALYRYFPNRDALVAELISVAYQSLQIELERIRQEKSNHSAKEQLLAIGHGYRLWGLAHPEDYALIFGTPIPGYQAPPESTLPLARSSLGVLIAVLQYGAVQGEFKLPKTAAKLSRQIDTDQSKETPTAPLMQAALGLWGLVHGLTSLELFNHFQMIVENAAELYAIEIRNKINDLLIEEKQ